MTDNEIIRGSKILLSIESAGGINHDNANADQSQDFNVAQMDKASEKVLMCKTYNVKYPVSLSVSKDLYVTGCENYQLRGYKGINKIAAEQETIISVCD